MFSFDPDPRTRHTIWTCVLGGYFSRLPPYAVTQTEVQRFLALPNMNRVKRALVINFVGLVIIMFLTFFTGLLVYAKFYDCDPLRSNQVSNSDQILPLFVSQTSHNIPGLLGLFTAGKNL